MEAERSAIVDTLTWEKANGLFEVKWLGVSPWRLVRKALIAAHLIERAGRGRPNYNERGTRQVLRMIGNTLRSIPQLVGLRRRRYLFVGFPRRRLDAGEWVDPFTDPLSELLGHGQSFCIEKPFAGRHFRPARTLEILYLDGAVLLAGLLGRAAAWLISPLAGRDLASLTEPVAARLSAPERRIRKIVVTAVAEFRVEAALMNILLRIVRPRCVLLTSRWVHAPLIWAAKRRGIRVLELQHGAVPRGGYAYATPFDRDLDPDAMLTFGPYWNEFDWGIDRRKVNSIGFRYVWLRRERMRGSGPRGRKVMLISKPSRHKYLAELFFDLASRNPRREFVLRLHPQDAFRWETRYPVGNLPNVTVSMEAFADLYDTFSECECVVGDESTVLYEAAFFGLTVAILNLDGRNTCPALAFAGQCGFVEVRSAWELDELLKRPQDAAPPEDTPFFADFDPARFEALVD